MRKKGTVANWNDRKGYGFIEQSGAEKQVFFHHSAFDKRAWRPAKNDAVSYSLSKDKSGRPCAVKVVPKQPRRSARSNGHQPGSNRRISAAIAFAGAFLVVAAVLAVVGKLPFVVPAYYVVVSLFTFAMYARDKAAAQSGKWRTPESTLHFLSLIGGWPGALLGQKVLRHKSSKKEFQLIFSLTVIINCVCFGWLLTDDGMQQLLNLASQVTSG